MRYARLLLSVYLININAIWLIVSYTYHSSCSTSSKTCRAILYMPFCHDSYAVMAILIRRMNRQHNTDPVPDIGKLANDYLVPDPSSARLARSQVFSLSGGFASTKSLFVDDNRTPAASTFEY